MYTKIYSVLGWLGGVAGEGSELWLGRILRASVCYGTKKPVAADYFDSSQPFVVGSSRPEAATHFRPLSTKAFIKLKKLSAFRGPRLLALAH